MIKRILSRRLVFVLAVTLLVWVMVRVIGPLDTIPRVRVAATSPDGKFTVQVLQKRLKLFPSLRFGVFVRVTDENQNEIYNRSVFEDSWWSSDLGEMYTRVLFQDDQILVGPKFDANDYLILKASGKHDNQLTDWQRINLDGKATFLVPTELTPVGSRLEPGSRKFVKDEILSIQIDHQQKEQCDYFQARASTKWKAI